MHTLTPPSGSGNQQTAQMDARSQKIAIALGDDHSRRQIYPGVRYKTGYACA